MTDHLMTVFAGTSRLVTRIKYITKNITQRSAAVYRAGFADVTVGDRAADDMGGYGKDGGAGDAAVVSVYK